MESNTYQSPEPKPTQSAIYSSRKKMKVVHSIDNDTSEAFDLSAIDAVLDLKCDIESEYMEKKHGEEENIKPRVNGSSRDVSEVQQEDESYSNPENENRDDVFKYADIWNHDLDCARNHLKYLNSLENVEEKTFSTRAKLFEYVKGRDYYFNDLSSHLFESNQEDGPARWVQRGVGQVKFLRYLGEGISYGTVRIAMHHEGTMKLLMSHLVEPRLEVTSTKDKRGKRQYMWCAKDNSMGFAQRVFALRFSTEIDALSWKQHFEESKRVTLDARLALDPECYAPPGTPVKEKIKIEETFFDEISKTLPFSPEPRSPFLQKRRRFVE